MSKAKITLLGFYKWDDTLFEELSLPDGIDTQTVIDDILVKGADFEVIYSDCDFTKEMIGLISRKWQRTFQKWYDALQIEYEPLYNFDRYEHWTDTGTDTGTVNREGTDTGTVNREGTDTGTVGNIASSSDTSSSNGQTDTFVTTYDSDTLHQDGRSTSTQTASSSGNDSSTETRNLADSDKETRNLADSDKETRNLATSGEHDGHLYGNIGVTTSQQMLESELDIAEWNLYEHIADIFIKELCIMVY